MKRERKVYGANACQALFENRPDSIIRAWFDGDIAKKFGPLMKALAQTKRGYHLCEPEEMERVAATRHHEGICLLVEPRSPVRVLDYLRKNRGRRDCVLALEGIGNPHNLGAIVRVCAHFGVRGVLSDQPEALQSGAAMRTAEGGFESITALRDDTLVDAIGAFKSNGYALVGTSSRHGQNLYGKELPRRCVIMMGSERDGLSPELKNLATHNIRIPGTGNVQSLNVACATTAILGEAWRTRG